MMLYDFIEDMFRGILLPKHLAQIPTIMSSSVEQKLRGIVLAIKFKAYVLGLDVQSRRHILNYCMQWSQLKDAGLYTWFQNANSVYMNDDDVSKNNWQMWDELYLNLSDSPEFKNLVSFFCGKD